MKKILSIVIFSILFCSIIKVDAFYSQSESPNEKIVYITFDDGPNINTLDILDVLSQYNMKATFFLLEGKMKDNPEIVKKILKEGHAIGLHGQTHEKKLFYANSLSVLKEVEHSRDYFKSLTNSDTKLVRVPYGSKPHLTKNQYYSLVENGYNMWDWNIDSTDTHKDASSSKIISHTLSEIDNYKTPVILFHDKKVTVDALPSILKYLYKNNYDSKSIQQEHPPMNWWNKTLY